MSSTSSAPIAPSGPRRIERLTLPHAAQPSSTKARSSRWARMRVAAAGTGHPQAAHSVPSAVSGRSRGSIGVSLPGLGDPPAPTLPPHTPGGYHRPTMTTTAASRAAAPRQLRHAFSKDKSQLIRRLSRMEGQVRGVARMIEREENCVDILQQTAALRAAVDALSIVLLEDHVQGCVRTAAARGEADRYVDEVIDVVRRTLGRPVRGGGRSA